jgi:sporulation protein YlmC with PRC-barrel domain
VEEAEVYLYRDVMDKELVDRHGHKAGKVDDLVLALEGSKPPAVRAIVTGSGGLLTMLPKPAARIWRWVEGRALGRGSVEPSQVDWRHVTRIDVVVHLDLDREEAGLIETERSLWRRWIKPLPWSER